MSKPIDLKFNILAVNLVNGHTYTEKSAFLMCAKDRAVVPALQAYIQACKDLGCGANQIRSAELMLMRVVNYQITVEQKVPDVDDGAEAERCVYE